MQIQLKPRLVRKHNAMVTARRRGWYRCHVTFSFFFFFVSVVFILISNGPGMAQYVTSTGLKLYYCSWKNSAYKIAFEVFDKFENNVTLCQLHHYTATTARQFTIDFLKNCPFPTMINPYIYVFIYFYMYALCVVCHLVFEHIVFRCISRTV